MTFEVKDSGRRQEYVTGMRRDLQDGKARFDLTIPLNGDDMLSRLAEHMRKGAEKYGERNWELAMTQEEYHRFRQSAFRHFVQWYKGEEDEDHAAAVFFNIQAAEYCKHRMNKLPVYGTTLAEPDMRMIASLIDESMEVGNETPIVS